MPNHIQNRLQVSGTPDQVKEVLNAIATHAEGKNEAIQMDFNKILPMPESLNITSGSLGDMAHELLFGTKKSKFFPITTEENQKRFAAMDVERQKEAVALAIQYQDNLVKYGATTWYDWAVENWGTKWNAYEQNDKRNTEDTIYFQTAWSAPLHLIALLSTKFPNVKLTLSYADEDGGSNVGIVSFVNGEDAGCKSIENQSKAAYELYFELHEGSQKNYKLVGDRYEYVETD
jgi:hypothetical protein